MAEIELVIRIDEEDFNKMKHNVAIGKPICSLSEDKMVFKVANGTPLPKGHGRLIDADALKKKMRDREKELGYDRAIWESSVVSVVLDMLAPIIIPADAESEVEE